MSFNIKLDVRLPGQGLNIFAGMNTRELFFRHLAQTTTSPLALEISRAEGCYLEDVNGRRYLDLVGGISVANVGHRHPHVIRAIKKQLDEYLHVMVYGEFVESPQVRYAKALADLLPSSLDSVYFTNSGSEAIEGAMKLAKRINGRRNMIAFNKSYHGSTQGALSLMGDENWRNAFRPLLPGVSHFTYNSEEVFSAIDSDCCCVILETIQAEAGVIVPEPRWLRQLRNRCRDTGALLVMDEVQAGFGRTGKLWGFENFDVIPDIVVLGKALGGGLPLGAFVSDRKWMQLLTDEPPLGHITTFGGHPLSCSAGLAALKILVDENLAGQVREKEKLFRGMLVHEKIRSVRSFGLWFAIEFGSAELNKKIIEKCLAAGVFTDWFLFTDSCMRISPPLTITMDELRHAAGVIIACID
jgi:acetylornithine/succinyldiaminopimelate/putrescine aminotransferase